MQTYHLSNRQRVGFEGELWAYEQLEKRGYLVTMATHCFEQNCDLRVGKLPIEVKVANQTWRKSPQGAWFPRWQFSISTTASQMQADWVLILIARDKKGCCYPYILPGQSILNRRHLQITSHPTKFRGWLSHWFNNWSIVEYLEKKVYRDGPLFEKWDRCISPPQLEAA